MKTLSLKTIGLGGLFSLLVSSAFAISSTPVGYVTHPVAANADVKLGVVLEQATSLSGSVSSVSTGTIDAGSAVGDLTTIAHYIKFTSGALAGQWFEVTGSTGSSITVTEDLESASLATSDNFQVIPFWTLDTLLPNGGGVATSTSLFGASPFQGLFITYDPNATGINPAGAAAHAYHDGSEMGTPGWYNVNTFALSGSTLINPDNHSTIRNMSLSPISIVVTGTVPSADMSLNIVSRSAGEQDNLVYNPFPAGITLANSNLYESGAVSPTPSLFAPSGGDFVFVYAQDTTVFDPSAADAYVYDASFDMGAPGWYNVNTFQLANDVVIGAGQAITIRKAQGSDSNISWNASKPYTL
jgi:uncharacterized protein (TIGR02597 family)